MNREKDIERKNITKDLMITKNMKKDPIHVRISVSMSMYKKEKI